MRLRAKLFLVFISCMSWVFVEGQSAIPSPSEFLPHQHGEQFTLHYQLVNYFEHIAERSSRVKLVEYGRSYEGRPLLLTFISTPENLARLKDIRNANLARTGLIEESTDAFADIAIVWLSFGVHGNEAGATESSMSTLYELTRTDRADVADWLEHAVVILDPAINPDGYARYTNWYRQVAGTQPDPNPQTLEHREPWPGGRPNHYLYDLNRDWAWATQIETQQRLKYYGQWMPHVHADFHEQFPDEPYYFAPAAEPYHTYITDWQRAFQNQIGQNHTRYFDAEGWLYFTREFFDLLYPSYGDTYPTFNGAIGMTYEQAGHGRSGRAIELETGDVLTLADRIEHHTATALSTLEIAAENAGKVVEEFQAFFQQAQTNPPGTHKTFVIAGDNKPADLKAFCRLLDLHHIRYGHLKSPREIRAYNYQTGAEEPVEVTTEDLVITAYQPQGVLAQILLEPEPQLEDSMTYDITAWALPYAYGLKAFAAEVSLMPETKARLPEAPKNELSENAYAYLAQWNSLEDSRFLGDLLEAGLHVRYLSGQTTIEDQQFEKGTLVITRGDNRRTENFARIVIEAARHHQVPLQSVQTGFAETGKDLGSNSLYYIRKPNVLLLKSDRTDSHNFGQIWHYFEQEIDYPVSIADMDRLGRLDLDDYTLIILPNGYYQLDHEVFSELDEWIKKGGRLIAVGSALNVFADKDGFQLRRKHVSNAQEDSPLKTYAESRRAGISNAVPGSIFKLKMDDTHPLAYGLNDYFFTLKTSGASYEYLERGWNVGYLDDELMVHGFTGGDARERLKETLCYGVEPHGRGHLIYMVDNPLFRSFWRNGLFLFSNAVFLVGQE